jgi:coenzyme F420-reducing hydrogenase delta subunit
MVNVSASSSQKFAEYVRDMVETIIGLGPARNKKTNTKEQRGALQ